MNVPLTLQHISECASITAHPDVPAHINDVVFDVKIFIDTILRNVSEKYELVKKDNSFQKYSLIDIRNFRNMCVKDLQEMFLVNFGLDFNKSRDIGKINELYQESINVIETRYGRKIDQTLITKRIQSANDVKEMLDITGKGRKGVQICAISKIFLGLALLRKDPRIITIDKVHSDITNLILAPFSNLDQEIEGVETGNILIDENNNKIISSRLLHRSKSISSCIGKQMGNINSNDVDDFKDLHGFTIEIDSQETTDMIFIFQKYYFLLLEKAKKTKNDGGSDIADIVIENQNLIDCHFEDGVFKVPDLEKIKDLLDPNFYDVFYESLKISKEKNDLKRENKGTAKSYKDLNITLKYKTKTHPKLELPDIYSGTEIKFTQKGNDNEKGLAFHGIFDYKKRFREMTRVFGFIHREDILFFVNEFFQNLDAKLSSKGKKRSKFFSELLSDIQAEHPELIQENFSYIPNNTENLIEIQKILYRYLLKEVVEVKISKSSKHTFFVHKSYFDLTPELNKEVFPV